MKPSVRLLIHLLLLFSFSCTHFRGRDARWSSDDAPRIPASDGANPRCTREIREFLAGTEDAEPTWLYGNLLKRSPYFGGNFVADDLTAKKLQGIMNQLAGDRIFAEMDVRAKLAVLRNFPLGDIVVAPGHRQLRNLEQIRGLVDYIKKSGGGDFSKDKILINVVTDAQGTVLSVDLWNAHHRLVAYVEAGVRTFGEIPTGNFEIVVNGKTQWGQKWGHYLPIGGVLLKNLPELKLVPTGKDVSEGTLNVDGALSNFQLGSRATLKQVHHNMLRVPARPKVGVFFGTFDPVHEGHVRLMRQAVAKLGLDELVVVPNMNPLHKDETTTAAQRLEMLKLRLAGEEKINLYVGNSMAIVDRVGLNPFFEQIIQTYGTYDLIQVYGADSFLSSVETGEYAGAKHRSFAVFDRDGTELPIMDGYKNVQLVKVDGENSLSSTKIRNALKAKEGVPASSMDPRVLEYIRKNSLYQTGNP